MRRQAEAESGMGTHGLHTHHHRHQAAPTVRPTQKRCWAQTSSAMRYDLQVAAGSRSTAPCSQEAKQYCRDVVQVLQALKEKRDMTFNEVRLIVQIEDPRAREQRRTMDIEVLWEFVVAVSIHQRPGSGGVTRRDGGGLGGHQRGQDPAGPCCAA